MSLNASDEQGRCVEHGGESADPALIGVLRAEVAEQRVGDMALEQFGGPSFPFGKKRGKGVFCSIEGVPAHELSRGWGRAGPGIKERDADFSSRECSVKYREVAHDDGEKAEACAGFARGED